MPPARDDKMSLVRPARLSPWGIAVVVATAMTVVVLWSFGTRIHDELQELRGASRDNVQWTLAQFEVEYLMLGEALDRVGEGKPDALPQLRRRFDIFYSRVDTLLNGGIYGLVTDDAAIRSKLELIKRVLNEAIPTIDGNNLDLLAGVPDLQTEVDALRQIVRQVSLKGVRLFAQASDRQRETLSALLFNTAAIMAVLIFILALLLATLTRQNRISARRAKALRLSSIRFEQTINASLNAIVVADEGGRVIEFNPAAEQTFGYSRNSALGQNIRDLLIPPKYRDAHMAGMKRYLQTREAEVIGKGRVELEAMRSNGDVFPVELSIAHTVGPDGDMFVADIRDITARIQAERELLEARDKALAAARAKSQFLAVMSHEMRTPLNGVLAMLDLLSNTRLAAKQREFVQTAITSGEILQHHIDDVLDITRIEAGRLTLQPRPVDLKALLQEVMSINLPRAEARGNTIEFTTDLPDRPVLADPTRIQQIVLNLVDNAVKFTQGGVIRVDAHLADGAEPMVIMSVADNGLGIARDDLDRIFDDFVTLDPSYRRTASGNGLGLSICQRIVRAMNGDIAVESEIGRGSRFTVRLPLEFIEAVVEGPAAEMGDVAEPRRELSILLVEDNETNRFAAREMLRGEGCRVTEAKDGLIGLGLSEQERFDLILMDISMPRLDGIEATRAIRNGTGASSDVPIIGLTAHALPEEQERLKEAGMQDCLFKPLRLRNLRRVLAEVRSAKGVPVGRLRTPAPSPSPSENETLDQSVLGELCEVMAPEMLADKLDTFCMELSGFPKLLRAAIGGDRADMRAMAHKASGSAAMFGAVKIHDILSTLEDACADGEDEFVVPLIDELEKAVPPTVEGLSAVVAELKKAPVS